MTCKARTVNNPYTPCNCLKGSSDIQDRERRSEEYKSGSRIELEDSATEEDFDASKTYDLPFKIPKALKFLPVS